MGTTKNGLPQVHVSKLKNESNLSTEEKENRKPLSNSLKYITTAVIFYGNISYGCGFTTYGPVITSLQTKFDVDDSQISKVFTFLTFGVMLGGLTAGVIYNYVNRQLAVITILTTMSTVMFITPHCPTLTTFFISATVMGFCSGAYDTAQMVWMMEMMQKDCPPYVLAQHFFFGVGTICSPLIMAPFLSNEIGEDEKSILESDQAEEHGSKLFVPYTIIGSLTALTAILQVLLFIFMRYRPPPPEIVAEAENSNLNFEDKRGLKIGKWSLPKLRMVVLSTIFVGGYVGMEMCTFQFFSKFGQNSNLNLTEEKAAYTLSGMTVAYATGRGIGIIAAFKVKPQIILCVNILSFTVANILLISWASNSLPVLWVSSILFGIGFSTMFPAFCAYIERYLRFTNFIGALMIVCGSGVAALYPLVVGHYIENNPVVLSYTVFFSTALIVFSFGTLSYLTHRNKTRY